MLIRLPKRQLALLVVGWAAAALIVVVLVAGGRRVALERSERASAAFAAVVEQHTARTFQAVQLTLVAIAEAHQIALRPAKNDPQFQDMMTRRLKALPYLRAIFVIGPDGWLRHDTDYPRTPNVSLADRPYFTAHRDEEALDVTFSPPIFSRSGTGWFIPITHRLPGERFEGVVVAALQTDYFSKQFESMALADGDVIALFHVDGTLIARYPATDEGIGKSFKHLPVFQEHLTVRPAGTFTTSAGLIAGQRVVSYRAVAGTPYVVHVSRSYEGALTEWRRTAVGAAVAMMALTLLLFWVVAYLVRQHAREERERERRVQAEKLEALGQFTGGVAHDFGNLLNVLAINVALMKQQSTNGAVVRESLAAAERTVERGRDLIVRLLGFARRREINVERCDLNDVVAGVRPLLEQAVGSRIEVVTELGANLPRVLCDGSELEIALINLAVNARDAMAGAGRIVVRTFACEHRFVCLSVEDNGPGMPEAVQRRAFDPFYTTKGEAGTGLGLWQVYGFMHRLGGSVRLDSAPGSGATIVLLFPCA